MSAPIFSQGADPGQPAAGLDLDAASTDLAVRLLKYGWAKRHISARDLGAAIANHFRAVMAPIPAAPAAPVAPDADRGLYRKFQVSRADGSSGPGGKHEKCRYYVLDLDHDRFAPWAINAYALACEMEYPHLARDLKMYVAGKTFGADGNVIRSYDLASLCPGSASTGAGQGEEGAGGLAEENKRLRYQLAEVLTLAGMDPQGLERKIQMLAEGSASSSHQRAFGQIREAVARAILQICREENPEANYYDCFDVDFAASHPARLCWLNYADRVLALLGEAPPTSGEAEQSHQVTNHKEAFELAQIKKAKSNLARCYLELREATPGATVQPQAEGGAE